MISEAKIDESFPTSQFLIDDFSSPYHLDRNSNGGSILAYFKNNITKSLKTINLPTEAIFTEMNLRSKKWLLCFTYSVDISKMPFLNALNSFATVGKISLCKSL